MLGANANNNFGVTGVDWNCKILPILVIDPLGFGNAMDLAQGLNYCATQDDVTIITMSLQNYTPNTTLQNAMAAASAAGKPAPAVAPCSSARISAAAQPSVRS